MPSLWKSGSTAGRAKAAGPRSIRGTISGPIPIPADDDDEFPLRSTGKTRVDVDEEFPIRKPGTGIASPVPPDEPDTTPEEQEEKQDFYEKPLKHESEHETDDEIIQPQDSSPLNPLAPGHVSESSHTGLAQEVNVEPSEPPTNSTLAPPSRSNESTSRPVSRSPPQRTFPPRTSPERVSPERISPLRISPIRVQTTPPRVRTSPPSRRTTNPLPSTVRYSTLSDTPSGKTSQSKDAPQRKKSMLRSALGRLFGRSKKKHSIVVQGSDDRSGRESEPLGASQHRSDPSALSRIQDVSPKRSVSLPLSEYDRPLRSHSIGPDDIMAIESARNSLQAEAVGGGGSGGTGIAGVAGRRRAATTTTSRLFLPPRIRTSEWGAGLSPRPASSHGRGSRLDNSGEPEDPNEIGRAITSDSGNGGRRRSRSLSGLQDFAGVRTGARRRSDEIRYWRESYDPGFMSPLSSNAQDDGDIDDTGVMDVSAPVSPAVERPPKTPPQPFNFGPFTNDMVGMKITQAASIDTRIGSLEGRARKLERVVDQLCHAVPGFRAPLHEAAAAGRDEPSPRVGAYSERHQGYAFAYTNAVPPTIPAIYQTSSPDSKTVPRYSNSRQSVETDVHSQASFGDAQTYIGSLYPPSSSATQSQSITTTAPLGISLIDRPASNSTVRGAASLPTMGRDADGSNGNSYAALVAQLETERAARQALEAQVKKLSERLNTLSTTMFAMVRDPAKQRSQERLTSSLGGSSPLQKSPATVRLAVSQRQESLQLPTHGVKTLSVFETDDDEEADDLKKEAPASVGVTEASDGFDEDNFHTPREEQPPLSYGAFGEELHPDDDDDYHHGASGGEDDDPKRKKAARTLSLSQLTLGKGQRTQI
ncbi:hypothetical protein B0T17DRAFT_495393 [Bombardia bombarda]|uniref:Uncharacterized protein n=1 Tax=Bombardia bombarda TaxID=252184 RepID=A0AA39WMH1_9PEZI|nr:hypothetical protein B0T17DRAFT_495393 [Bombardia bombarda]